MPAIENFARVARSYVLFMKDLIVGAGLPAIENFARMARSCKFILN